MNYSTPGIYIEEVPGGKRPIQAVGTSTAGFVGVAPDLNASHKQAKACNNWTEFVNTFASSESIQSTPLSQAVYGFFQNGGSRCYVVAIAETDSIQAGLDILEQVDEVAIVAAPSHCDPASHDALLTHCEKLKDRVAILDGPDIVEDVTSLTEVPEETTTKSSSTPGGRKLAAKNISSEETPSSPQMDTGTPKPDSQMVCKRPRISKGGYGAFYYPWIIVRDPFNGANAKVAPSGHIAGIWARTDATRGVHKAPANEPIRGALGVTHKLTHQEQGMLNPAGVNVIRFFPREGVLVWGGRTVDESSSEWRYLSVRRLFNMIEESIATSTRWIVFEPNDRTLWKSIRRDITAFLNGVWRDGALMGRTPEEAFFVKCDDETNPSDSIDEGKVVTVIGIAPVKPAEFIIFRISQSELGPEIQTEAANA